MGSSVFPTSSGCLISDNLSMLLFWSNLNKETTCSSLKEYSLLARAWPGAIPPLTNSVFEGDLTSAARIYFLLGWEDDPGARHIGLSGLDLMSFSSFLSLMTISSACSPYSTNCFQVRHSVSPIWSSRKVCRLWQHVSDSVDSVMLLRQWSVMLRNLSTDVLIDSPFFCLAVRRVGIKILYHLQRNEPETTSWCWPMS